MKFAFYTLGCKTNQYETQAMEHFLLAAGHTLGSFSEPCDGYIINTCSVTAVADKKNRAVIRRCRRENPNAVIGVCGCYPQHAAAAVKELGVDVIGGSAGREKFIDMMHNDGKLVWVNSIIYDHRRQLSGGHSDDTALTVSEDYGWGWLADRGFDFIQTDWTMMLVDYLKKSNKYYR